MSMLRSVVMTGSLFLAVIPAVAVEAASAPADRAYANGIVFTADAGGTIARALAIQGGRIVYVGDDAGLAPFLGPATVRVDLASRFLMPGLVDGHMHPVEAGSTLLKCSLHYDALTVVEFQRRIQACLDGTDSA